MRSLFEYAESLTLGDLEKESAGLLVRCRSCGFGGRLPVQLAIGDLGRDATLDDVRSTGRCPGCGGDHCLEVAADWQPPSG